MTINSSDYHDYVIKNGKFIGKFEQMYQNIEDPWYSVKNVNSLDNNLFLTLVKHSTPLSGRVLDVGCGLGALTARLREQLPKAEIHACDMSETAIEKASKRYVGISFFTHDLSRIESMPFEAASFDVITAAQIIWYILPSLPKIMSGFHRLLRDGGHLVVLQYFLHPDEQKYGKEIIETPEDLIHLVTAAGFHTEKEIYINRCRPQNLLLLAVKGSNVTK